MGKKGLRKNLSSQVVGEVQVEFSLIPRYFLHPAPSKKVWEAPLEGRLVDGGLAKTFLTVTSLASSAIYKVMCRSSSI